MHAYFVFGASSDAFNFAPVFCELEVTFARFCNAQVLPEAFPTSFSHLFDGFFIFLVFKIDEVNSFHFSSVIELGFPFRPFFLSFFLNGFTNFDPYFWPYMIMRGSRLNSCQSPTRSHIPRGWFFHQ